MLAWVSAVQAAQSLMTLLSWISAAKTKVQLEQANTGPAQDHQDSKGH